MLQAHTPNGIDALILQTQTDHALTLALHIESKVTTSDMRIKLCTQKVVAETAACCNATHQEIVLTCRKLHVKARSFSTGASNTHAQPGRPQPTVCNPAHVNDGQPTQIIQP
jgi:hypothetical protein